jgi:hypothetical protein
VLEFEVVHILRHITRLSLPAKAGNPVAIELVMARFRDHRAVGDYWMPALAGMTPILRHA